jgi:hypothetical protein
MTSSRVISFIKVRDVPNEHDFLDLLRYVGIFRLQMLCYLIIWKRIDDVFVIVIRTGAKPPLDFSEHELMRPDCPICFTSVQYVSAWPFIGKLLKSTCRCIGISILPYSGGNAFWIFLQNVNPERVTWHYDDCITTFIVHFFSSVAHVWVAGAKTTGPIVEMFGFS